MNDVLFASDTWPHHWWFLLFPLFWLLVFACLFRFVVWRRGGCWSRGDRPGPERAQGILRLSGGELHLDVPQPGRHNLENAAAAAVVGIELGLEPHAIAASLARFPGVARRLEVVGTTAW